MVVNGMAASYVPVNGTFNHRPWANYISNDLRKIFATQRYKD
ncbi:hypothetical protein YPPY72_4440 [Yersinia pestis PY-72]|nr:hypothetical protein YPPY72_4440 [Yersinia pestis PY-72]EIT52400.1 hypothetical protein YPPY103_4591 [Yersinia pestis PY-103]